jgi:hypothetical protein
MILRGRIRKGGVARKDPGRREALDEGGGRAAALPWGCPPPGENWHACVVFGEAVSGLGSR